MKKFFFGFLLPALLCSAADHPFTPGGVAVDWAQFDPKVQIETPAVNLVKNGSFEMPGTVLSGWRNKGHWAGWAHLHGKNTPLLKEFNAKLLKAATRQVSTQQSFKGKYAAYIKTPDHLRELIKPFPMVSNKISQTVAVTPENQPVLYTLVFMAKGFHTPTVTHNGQLVVQMQGKVSDAQKAGKKGSKGVQANFKLRSEWTRYNVNILLPANCDKVSITLNLYGVGEAYFDDVQLFPASAVKKDHIQVRISPYSQLDNTYCLGEKLPGVINFTFNSEAKKFKRKKLKLELTLPENFKVVDTRDNCTFTKGPGNTWQIDLMGMTKVAFTRAWYMLQACSVMVESTLPASEKLYPASFRLTDGAWKGQTHAFNLKVIPAHHGKRPALFRSSAMLGHEFSFKGAGTEKTVDFYDKSGFSCIHGAKPALAKALKNSGILRYSPNYFLANGFRLGAAPKTGNARFIMADGSHFNRKICPVEVYTRGPYYMTEIYEKILKKLILVDDVTDIFMTNWEPYYLDSKGCFCERCRDEFIKYSKGKPSKAEIMAVWPKDLLRKYADEYFKFRSWQHGQLVITLHKDAAALGKLKNKEGGFVPEISWRSVTHERNSYCRQYNVKDYMYELPWLEPWGPYIFNRAGLPYNYYPTAHLPTYVAAGMMKKFIHDNFKNRKAPGMIAFPHGHQGEDWVTEAEAFAFEMLTFFVRGWEGVFGYYFPRGYDYRHWRAAAEANTLIARYENFTFKGRNDNQGVKVTPVTPLPEKLHYAPGWQEPEGEKGQAPGISKMGPIQFQTWRYNGEMLVCVGNFWQKGENFFKLQIAGLAPDKKYGVEVSGTGCGNHSGKELAAGILLQCGALRWQFIKVGKSVKESFSQNDMKQLLAARKSAIEKAVAWEKAYYKKISSYATAENPVVDYNAIKSITSKNVTLTASAKSSELLVKTPVYTLRVAPGQGGRIHDWKKGKEVLFAQSKILGFAVPGVWYPKKSAMQLLSGMTVEKIAPVPEGVMVHLSRLLTPKDKRALAGLKFELIHIFAADKVTSTFKVTNPLHDAVELAVRFHNMPSLLGKVGKENGNIRFASGELFQRDFDQKLIKVGKTDGLLEQTFKIVKQQKSAKKLPVILANPAVSGKLEFTFPVTPHSIVVWDNVSQSMPTFEPVFPRTQIVPGKSAEFSMSVTVK